MDDPNGYGYCFNNPVNNNDPTGHFSVGMQSGLALFGATLNAVAILSKDEKLGAIASAFSLFVAVYSKHQAAKQAEIIMDNVENNEPTTDPVEQVEAETTPDGDTSSINTGNQEATQSPPADEPPKSTQEIIEEIEPTPPVETESSNDSVSEEDWKFTSDPLDSMEVRGKSKSNTFGENVRKNDDGTPRPHQGVDLKASVGTNIKSVENGEVVRIVKNPNDKKSYGNYIVIKFEKGGKTNYALYAHLSEIGSDISVGTKITAGQVLGKTGKTGNAYNMSKANEHLHFELNTSDSWGTGIGTRIDPLIRFRAQLEVK